MQEWDKIFEKEGVFFTKPQADMPKVVRLFKKNKVKRILDLGCGVGSLSFYMASKENDVTGVDISKNAIDVANQSSKIILHKGKAKFLNKRIESLSFDNKFDFILASEILEHTKNDDLILKKINFFLKPGGVSIISVPSINAPLFKLGFLTVFDKAVGHKRRYSSALLMEKLTKNNLSVHNIYKREGFLRNLLFTNNKFSFLIRFFKGPISMFVNYLDNLTVGIIGESQLIFVCRKLKI